MPSATPRSLKARAIVWLSQRDHSRGELAAKLKRMASDDEQDQIEPLLDWLVAHRYLDERRFAESRVHARSAKFGNRRIQQELAQHGVAIDAATAAQLKTSEFGRAQLLWSRRFGGEPAADAATRAKQMRFLAGRGFSADLIRKVVGGHGEDD
jgi:regulatory protein